MNAGVALFSIPFLDHCIPICLSLCVVLVWLSLALEGRRKSGGRYGADIERQTRKKICGQMASSHDCSSNPILPCGISIVFEFSCSLGLEVFSEGNSLSVLELLVSFLSDLEKIVKRDGVV